MLEAPKGLRLQIGIFGLRNAGKSSLVNLLTGQKISIVSNVPGTTTDPVEKAMEMHPVGPVLFMDTAGLDDDAGTLGASRVARTRDIMDRTDLALIVSGTGTWTAHEFELADFFARKNVPVLAVFNQCDRVHADPALLDELKKRKIGFVEVSAEKNLHLPQLRAMIVKHVPEDFLNAKGMLANLAKPGSMILLVTPIDIEAPKGRMILPQVQAIRDILDHDAWCSVVKVNALAQALQSLNRSPDLVVTDSQAFAPVAGIVPQEIPLTSFSILSAAQKADLTQCAEGAAAIDALRDSDRVLIAEACTHHPVEEDIGTVKIPNLLRKRTGKDLVIEHLSGHDFLRDLSGYKLVIHCGGCTLNRREMLARAEYCRNLGVPLTNYGVCIAHCCGILERALAPFPEALNAFRNTQRERAVHEKHCHL